MQFEKVNMDKIFKMVTEYQRNRKFENSEELSAKMFKVALILFISDQYPLACIYNHEISFEFIGVGALEEPHPYLKLKPNFAQSFTNRMIEHYPEKML